MFFEIFYKGKNVLNNVLNIFYKGKNVLNNVLNIFYKGKNVLNNVFEIFYKGNNLTNNVFEIFYIVFLIQIIPELFIHPLSILVQLCVYSKEYAT